MLHLRDHRLYSIRRNPLAIFVPLLLQSMTLVAIYRALNFYRFENTIIYYMPEWAVVLFYLFSFLLGHALQKIFLVSERSIYSLFSLGSCFTLLCGWLLGSSMLLALNYTIVLVSFSFVQSFKQFETDNFDMAIYHDAEDTETYDYNNISESLKEQNDHYLLKTATTYTGFFIKKDIYDKKQLNDIMNKSIDRYTKEISISKEGNVLETL